MSAAERELITHPKAVLLGDIVIPGNSVAQCLGEDLERISVGRLG